VSFVLYFNPSYNKSVSTKEREKKMELFINIIKNQEARKECGELLLVAIVPFIFAIIPFMCGKFVFGAEGIILVYISLLGAFTYGKAFDFLTDKFNWEIVA